MQGFANYYSLNKAVDLVADGGTITVLGNTYAYDIVITDKTLTVQGVNATTRPVVTNAGGGSTPMFRCYGDAHLTLKDLEINAKARAVNFQLNKVDGALVVDVNM